MKLAIFGDVHGNLDDMYRSGARWEKNTGLQIAHVLQVGDLGAFRRGGTLDNATLRRAQRDPSELGCCDYIEGLKHATHPTVFVRGNHEDFEFLATTGRNWIDPFGLIKHLHSGEVFSAEAGGEVVRISGLGGVISKPLVADSEGLDKYFTDRECGQLFALAPGSVDVLLFHEAPYGFGFRDFAKTGAKKVTAIIGYLQPRFAFYGHYGNPPDPFSLGKTECVGMNNRTALRLPRRVGAMGILDSETWRFSFVGNGQL